MDLKEAIAKRHSVRGYKTCVLPDEIIAELQKEIKSINLKAGLNIQLITDEPKAYSGIMSYGKFSGVTNYFVMAGKESADLDEKIGYYGEYLVLSAQMLGLNTCWTGLSYRKVKDTFSIANNERIKCYIAVGYGITNGAGHKTKDISDICDISEESPQWLIDGLKAAILAPTAINQQKFSFSYIGTDSNGNILMKARKGFSLVGYTAIDLGIAKMHFEIGSGKNIVWT